MTDNLLFTQEDVINLRYGADCIRVQEGGAFGYRQASASLEWIADRIQHWLEQQRRVRLHYDLLPSSDWTTAERAFDAKWRENSSDASWDFPWKTALIDETDLAEG